MAPHVQYHPWKDKEILQNLILYEDDYEH